MPGKGRGESMKPLDKVSVEKALAGAEWDDCWWIVRMALKKLEYLERLGKNKS
jgi:hypothetical protein